MGYKDTRVQYTKTVLQQALLKILKKKSIDRVTVTELCAEARINRGTFYLHYQTPNDLLMEIEQQFIDENMVFSKNFLSSQNQADHLSMLFESMFRNKELCSIIMGKNANPRFLDRLKELIRPSVVDRWSMDFAGSNRVDLEYLFDYVFSGSMRLILNWIEDDCGITPQELAVRLERLGYYSQVAVREFGK